MRKINEFSKIGIALIWISLMFLTGCTSPKEIDIFQGSLEEDQADFEALDVDYVINDDGTYTYKDIHYNYKIEVSGVEGEKPVTFVILTNDKKIRFNDVTDSLKKSEISTDEPQFIILGWY